MQLVGTFCPNVQVFIFGARQLLTTKLDRTLGWRWQQCRGGQCSGAQQFWFEQGGNFGSGGGYTGGEAEGAATVTKSPLTCNLPASRGSSRRSKNGAFINSPHKTKQASRCCVLRRKWTLWKDASVSRDASLSGKELFWQYGLFCSLWLEWGMWVTVLQSRGLLVLVLAFQMPMKKGGGSTRRISQKKKAKVDPDLDRYQPTNQNTFFYKNILKKRLILS